MPVTLLISLVIPMQLTCEQVVSDYPEGPRTCERHLSLDPRPEQGKPRQSEQQGKTRELLGRGFELALWDCLGPSLILSLSLS